MLCLQNFTDAHEEIVRTTCGYLVCKILAFMAVIMDLGLLFYIPLGFRYSAEMTKKQVYEPCLFQIEAELRALVSCLPNRKVLPPILCTKSSRKCYPSAWLSQSESTLSPESPTLPAEPYPNPSNLYILNPYPLTLNLTRSPLTNKHSRDLHAARLGDCGCGVRGLPKWVLRFKVSGLALGVKV